MRTVYIDDAGSLHPNSKDKYFVLGALSLSNKDVKAVHKAVKKILRIIKEPELKANELTKEKKAGLFENLKEVDAEFLVIYLDIGKLKNKFPLKFKKFKQKLDDIIRAIGISLIAEYFINKHTVITDIIFDKIFTKKVSDAILKTLRKVIIQKSSYARYSWLDSVEDKGIQVADVVANSYFRHLESNEELSHGLKSKLISSGNIKELHQKWHQRINKEMTKRQEAPSPSLEASSHSRFTGQSIKKKGQYKNFSEKNG